MKKYVLLALLSFWLCSCNNDLEINAPYRDNMFVYGLLNAQDTTHFVRIHKGFLPDPTSNISALNVAKIPDSSNYKPGQLTVTLLSQKGTNLPIKVANLEYTIIEGKEGTDFAPNTVIYKSPKIGRLDTTMTYFIEIRKPDGQIVSAQTPLIGRFETVFPFRGTGYTLNLRSTFRLERQPNAEAYKARITIDYQEFIGSSTPVLKTLVFEVLPQTVSGSSAMVSPVSLRDFLIANIDIKNDPSNLRRRCVRADLEIWALGSPVARSIQAANSYSALSQQKIMYTNVSNGFGIFSTRAYRKIICRISAQDLQTDRVLQSLKFVE